jgi:hypothetical protein
MKYYVYGYLDVGRPVWTPLQDVAAKTTKRRDLPAIHPAEFMYMGHLRSRDGEPDLHLYKHYDSRRYLNIDDQLRFFAFVVGDHDQPFFETDVYYRRLRSMREAIERLDLDRLSPRPVDHHRDGVPDNVVPLRRRRPGGSVA